MTYGQCNTDNTTIFQREKYLDPPWPPPGEFDDADASDTDVNASGFKFKFGRALLERWTECYPMDDQLHRFAIGIILSNRTMSNRFQNDSRQALMWMNAMIAASNLVFVPQMNIELYLKQEFYDQRDASKCDSLQVWNRPDACVETGVQCIRQLLNQLTEFTACNNGKFTSVGSIHLIDDWPFISGAGVAYIGSICDETFKTAVDGFATNLFRTFAHELLHNLNAIHPLDENGQIRTQNIGLMGYGDGKLNGEYAVDEGNRPRVCSKLAERLRAKCPAFTLPITTSAPSMSVKTNAPSMQTSSPTTGATVTVTTPFPTITAATPFPSKSPSRASLVVRCARNQLNFDSAVQFCGGSDKIASAEELDLVSRQQRRANYLWINYDSSNLEQRAAKNTCKEAFWTLRYHVPSKRFACKARRTKYHVCCV